MVPLFILTLPPRLQAFHEFSAKTTELLVWKHFGQSIRDVFLRWDKNEADDFVCDLFTKPGHFNCEVTVASGHSVIVYHSNACLVVFVYDGGGGEGKTKLCKQSSEPENIFSCLGGCDEFAFSCR